MPSKFIEKIKIALDGMDESLLKEVKEVISSKNKTYNIPDEEVSYEPSLNMKILEEVNRLSEIGNNLITQNYIEQFKTAEYLIKRRDECDELTTSVNEEFNKYKRKLNDNSSDITNLIKYKEYLLESIKDLDDGGYFKFIDDFLDRDEFNFIDLKKEEIKQAIEKIDKKISKLKKKNDKYQTKMKFITDLNKLVLDHNNSINYLNF